MSSEALRRALVDLGWSLFTELGVPGVVRHHRRVALDPEPLIVSVPALFELDPRLRDQVYGWCASHAGRLSVSRLQGLSRGLPEAAQAEFRGLAATLRRHAKVRWPDEGALAWPLPPEVKARRLPVERPALLRFRVRALCGVGARADVLSELLARGTTWTRASELAEAGYSKRAVAGILSELAEAGVARQLAAGNALTFQLAHQDQLRTLLGADNLAYPNWVRIMSLVLTIVELRRLEGMSPTTRRVEANRRRERLRELSDELWLDTPPVTRGNVDAWSDLMSWATRTVRDIAAGVSPALGVFKVRAAVVEGGGEVWVWIHRTTPGYDRLSTTLREADRAAAGVACTAVSPTSDGWTTFRLMLEPRLDEAGVHTKVEHLVSPMKVAWRRVLTG